MQITYQLKIDTLNVRIKQNTNSHELLLCMTYLRYEIAIFLETMEEIIIHI